MKMYILVHAVFHDADDEDRKVIYKCLEDKKWRKIHEHRVTTLWTASGELLAEQMSEIAKKDFKECAKKRNKKVDIFFLVSPLQVESAKS